MKIKVFLAFIALFLTGNNLLAQSQERPLQSQEVQKNKFITLGFSGNTVGNEFFPGVILGFGYYISPRSFLSIEFSGGGKNGEQIGRFTYYVEKNGNRENFSDGKIYYNYNYYLPIVSWSYVSNISEQFQWRIGPSVGLLSISTGDSYSPTTKDGATISGIEYSDRKSGVAGMLGANMGITWNFHKRWFVDLGYRLSVNTGVHNDELYLKFSGSTEPERDFGKIGNQFNLNLGWRF